MQVDRFCLSFDKASIVVQTYCTDMKVVSDFSSNSWGKSVFSKMHMYTESYWSLLFLFLLPHCLPNHVSFLQYFQDKILSFCFDRGILPDNRMYYCRLKLRGSRFMASMSGNTANINYFNVHMHMTIVLK